MKIKVRLEIISAVGIIADRYFGGMGSSGLRSESGCFRRRNMGMNIDNNPGET